MALESGQPAPDFVLPRDGGGTVALSELRGRHVVLFFYPTDDTPACTVEAQDFSALGPRFEAAGAVVLGLSAGSVEGKVRFVRKAGLGLPLLADETGDILKAYGVWQEKSLFGRRYMGIVRTTVLVDPSGKVARVWRVSRVKGHAKEVLAAVEARAKAVI